MWIGKVQLCPFRSSKLYYWEIGGGHNSAGLARDIET